jgi:hypothetical protein
MKTTRIFSAFAALVIGIASFSALPAYAEDEETMYGDIRYSRVLNAELGIYAGDTLDCSKVILEAVMYDWEGKASYVYSFTVGSGEFADLYTLDTTQVDTETPGDYQVVIRPAAGETGSFPYKSISPVQYHDLCMKGTESAIPVKIYDKDYNADTPLYLRCYKEYIEMICGEGVMIPLIGAYPAKVEYEVEDETIARVERSSTTQELVLWGLKEGETTVTVRTSDGRTATEKVRVLPPIVTETEPLVFTTTTLPNPALTATTTTVTFTTPDPATTTTKWWYQYETTEPKQTSTAIWTEAASHTTVADEKGRFRDEDGNIIIEHNGTTMKLNPGTADDDLSRSTTETSYTTATDEKGRILDENGDVLIINGTSAVVSGNITDIVLPDNDWGNANCKDGTDISDAVLIARYIVQDKAAVITDQGLANADLTHDGNVDGEDLSRLMLFLGRIITFDDLKA